MYRLYPEDRGSAFRWKDGEVLLDCVTSYSRMHSICLAELEPKIPQSAYVSCAVCTGVTRAFNCWTSLRNSSLVGHLTAETLWYPANFVEYTVLWAADSCTAVPKIPRLVWNVNLCFPLPFQCFFFFERFWNVTFVCGLVNFVYRTGSGSRGIGYHTHRKCLCYEWPRPLRF